MFLERILTQRRASQFLALGLLAMPAALAQANVLDNPGFESGATGWKVWSSAANALSDPTVVTDAGQAHAGSNFAQVDWVTGESFLTLSQELDVAAKGLTAGSNYEIKLWYKTSTLQAADNLRINFTNVVAGGSAYLNNAGMTGTQTAWTEQTFAITLPTGQSINTYQLQINPSLSAPGTIYIDDVSLDTPAPVGNQNLLDNPGFESGSTGWTVWSSLGNANTSPPVTTDAGNAYEGTNFAQITWPINESYLILYRDIDTAAKGMVAGEPYTFSFWYKTDAGYPAGQTVQMIITNTTHSGSYWFNTVGMAGPQTAWVEQSAVINLPTDQSVSLYTLQIRPNAAQGAAAGSLFVDNCSVKAGNVPVTLSQFMTE